MSHRRRKRKQNDSYLKLECSSSDSEGEGEVSHEYGSACSSDSDSDGVEYPGEYHGELRCVPFVSLPPKESWGEKEQEAFDSNVMACVGSLMDPAVEVRRLLQRGIANLGFTCMLGRPALVHATTANNIDCVQVLLEMKACPNQPGPVGRSALTYACQEGYSGIAELLIAARASVGHAGMFHKTPLMLAAQTAREECVELLLRKGASVMDVDVRNQTAFSHACRSGHLQVARVLIAHGSNINQQDEFGDTELMKFCSLGCPRGVELLLEFGADKNLKNDDGETAIILCCKSAAVNCAKLLLEQDDVDADCVANDGSTAFNSCSRDRNGAVLQLMLRQYGVREGDQDEGTEWGLGSQIEIEIVLFHHELKEILSSEVVVDKRIGLMSNGLYHEPLERVMHYCGLNLLSRNDVGIYRRGRVPELLQTVHPITALAHWWNGFSKFRYACAPIVVPDIVDHDYDADEEGEGDDL